jgi:hypothetical protein
MLRKMTHTIISSLLLAITVFYMSGCAASIHTDVGEPPPSRPGYVWVRGHYDADNHWVAAHWERQPPPPAP